MKRTRSKSAAARGNNTTTDFWAKPVAEVQTWEQQTDGKADDAYAPYALAQHFALGQLIVHTKFGKGVVVDADALRIEILFEDGKKKLGHGQAA